MKKLLISIISIGLLVPTFAFAVTQADCDAYKSGLVLKDDQCVSPSAPPGEANTSVTVTKTVETGSTQGTPQPTPSQSGTPGNTPAFCKGGTCTYIPLEPLPCDANVPGSCEAQRGTATFASLLAAAFKLLITLGSLFAVIMIVISGIGYMLSETPLAMEKAKERAWAAMKGLLLLGAAWLIIYTINPKLLKFDLIIPNSVVTGAPNQPTSPTTKTTGSSNPSGDNSKEFKQSCSGLGGESGRTISGAVCSLPSAKTNEECSTAGGTWTTGWTLSKYCALKV